MSKNPFAKYHHEAVAISELYMKKRGKFLDNDEIRNLLLALENEKDEYPYKKWIVDNFPEMVYPYVLEEFKQEVERRNLN